MEAEVAMSAAARGLRKGAITGATFRVCCLLLALFALGTAARLWYLDTLPSPAGDEANWLLAGLQTYGGERPEFQSSEMSFVPTTYAYFIAGLYQLFGPSVWSARLTSVLALLLGTMAVLAASLWWRRPTLSVVLAVLLLLHPWSLAWSRLVFAPYGLSLVLAVLGPLCWLMALEVRGPWRGLALVAAGQVLVLGLHFSPLAAIAIVSCALWTFFRPGSMGLAPWVAAVFMVVHAFPIVWSAIVVAALPGQPGSDKLIAQESSADKLTRYTLANLDIITGEATVREFSNVALQGEGLWLARGGMTLSLILALAALRYARRRTLPCAAEQSGPTCSVGTQLLQSERAVLNTRMLVLNRFSHLYLLAAFAGVPLILGVGRSWSLPCIDSERYGFAILAPTCLFLAAAATCVRWSGLLLGVFVAVFCVAPSLRLATALATGGGPELGFFNFDGGGWRLSCAAKGPVSVAAHLDALLRRESAKEPVTLLFSDSFSFHPMEFEIAKDHDKRVGIRILYQGRLTGEYAWPILPANSLMVFVVWHDSLFLPGEREIYPNYFRPGPSLVQDRKEFQRSAVAARLLEVVPQPDGSPLLEIWQGRYPKTPIVNLPPGFPDPADFQ